LVVLPHSRGFFFSSASSTDVISCVCLMRVRV
jgi:hypothetical protein